ncbi:hypothetical protein C8Q72DRAFT_615136 [Fomitopsis betulina]|nr:hypothetical protein C8Q72DRAFT_615136 [Fomitopsis betulina]
MPRKRVALERNASRDTQTAGTSRARKNVRGKKGGLEDMPNMPLDILFEIFCCLEPRDLLNLARTTKPFRRFLMSRRSAQTWRAARANVEELPDCPAHLSEPQYANLLFFPYCNNCLRPNVRIVLWEFSARYCPTCTRKRTIALREMRGDLEYAWAYFYMSDEIFTQMYLYGKRTFHCPELDSLKRTCQSLRREDEQFHEWRMDRTMQVSVIENHANLCREWDENRAKERLRGLQLIRKQRLDAIVSKLRELGFGAVLNSISAKDYAPLATHPHVRQSKPLTDRGRPHSLFTRPTATCMRSQCSFLL